MTAQSSLALTGSAPAAPVSLAADPTSAAPTDEIAAWAESHQRAYLISFAGFTDHMPLDALVDTIRMTCQRGFGVWMEPPAGNPAKSIRPATHLIEIALFGVTGSGTTPIEAANSWRIAARRALDDGEPA